MAGKQKRCQASPYLCHARPFLELSIEMFVSILIGPTAELTTMGDKSEAESVSTARVRNRKLAVFDLEERKNEQRKRRSEWGD